MIHHLQRVLQQQLALGRYLSLNVTNRLTSIYRLSVDASKRTISVHPLRLVQCDLLIR
jgi:hypothetical protein